MGQTDVKGFNPNIKIENYLNGTRLLSKNIPKIRQQNYKRHYIDKRIFKTDSSLKENFKNLQFKLTFINKISNLTSETSTEQVNNTARSNRGATKFLNFSLDDTNKTSAPSRLKRNIRSYIIGGKKTLKLQDHKYRYSSTGLSYIDYHPYLKTNFRPAILYAHIPNSFFFFKRHILEKGYREYHITFLKNVAIIHKNNFSNPTRSSQILARSNKRLYSIALLFQYRLI